MGGGGGEKQLGGVKFYCHRKGGSGKGFSHAEDGGGGYNITSFEVFILTRNT